jgi:hypothetical protein
MITFKFSHRATGLPGGNLETDRVVICDGLKVGRVHQVEAGQLEGLWQWSCYWIGTDTRVTASTSDEGLEAIKSRVTVEALQNLLPGHGKTFQGPSSRMSR